MKIIRSIVIAITIIASLCSMQIYNVDFVSSKSFAHSIQYCQKHHRPFYIVNFVNDTCIEVFDNNDRDSKIYKSAKQLRLNHNRYIFMLGNEPQQMEDFAYYMCTKSKYVYWLYPEK